MDWHLLVAGNSSTRVVAILAALACNAGILAQPNGTIYVSPSPRTVSGIARLMPPNKSPIIEKHEFSIQVDQLPPAMTSESNTVAIHGLALGEKHLLQVRDFGETVESFWFSFEKRGSTSLCLWYSPFYNTWSLWPQQEAKHFCETPAGPEKSDWTTELENLNGVTIKKPLLLDVNAESADPSKPAFLAPPSGAKVYHGYPLIPELCLEGYCYGAITDYLHDDSGTGCTIGDGFVEAPDGTRAGIVWEVSSAWSYSRISEPSEARWGVFRFTILEPVRTIEDLKKVFYRMLPVLKREHGKYLESKKSSRNTDTNPSNATYSRWPKIMTDTWAQVDVQVSAGALEE